MTRRLLPLAMIVSLWPVGFIALSVATASTRRAPKSSEENVTVPSPSHNAKPATVRVKVNGRTYYCPSGTSVKLAPIDERVGELQLQVTSARGELQRTLRRLSKLDRQYPGKTAPTQAIANDYNGLVRTGRRLDARESSLIHLYNGAVQKHNHVLRSDCH